MARRVCSVSLGKPLNIEWMVNGVGLLFFGGEVSDGCHRWI